MIILRVWQAPLTRLPQSALHSLCDSLPPSLRPLIRPAREIQAKILGLAPELLSSRERPRTLPWLDEYALVMEEFASGMGAPPIDAEVFTDGTNLFVIEINKRRRSDPGKERFESTDPANEFTLSLYYVGSNLDSSELRDAEAAINSAFGVSLARTVFNSPKFVELRNEGRIPPSAPEPNESEACQALRDRQTRDLAVAIKSSGGLLVRDLPKIPSVQASQVEEIRRRLESLALVDSEIVVVCRRSQTQIARVPSRDVLESLSRQGVRCACGRPISEETVEEALAITDLGRALLDGSRWLTLLLLEELQQVGVDLDHTLIEQQVGGDEIDCLAVIAGKLVFFELKDKDFSLGNAYSFGAKMGIIRPDHAAIFSTHKIGGDAREHFQRARLARRRRGAHSLAASGDSSDVHYLEGLERLRDGVQQLATAIYKADARRILARVLPLAALEPGPLLSALERDVPCANDAFIEPVS